MLSFRLACTREKDSNSQRGRKDKQRDKQNIRIRCFSPDLSYDIGQVFDTKCSKTLDSRFIRLDVWPKRFPEQRDSNWLLAVEHGRGSQQMEGVLTCKK